MWSVCVNIEIMSTIYHDDYNKRIKVYTDQPKKKKAPFLRFAAVHPLREIIFFSRRKIKITYFAEGFLRDSSRRNSATFRGDTPRVFAEKLGEISRWVGKDLRFLYADSEDWSNGDTELMTSLIWVFTGRVIKPTQNHYVPNITTGCATIGEEQCTRNCNFIFQLSQMYVSWTCIVF